MRKQNRYILHNIENLFVFRLFAELQSLKGKNYMFNLLAILRTLNIFTKELSYVFRQLKPSSK